jgi:hypothetical protein
MAGKQVVSKIQLGNNATASQNFLISEFGDGTMKIQRGNDGGALTDVLTIGADGKITSAYDVAAGQLGLTANGYAKLANGLIIQWGKSAAAIAANSGVNIVFPVTFPNALLSVAPSLKTSADANALNPSYSAETTAGFRLSNGAEAASDGYSWIALGY